MSKKHFTDNKLFAVAVLVILGIVLYAGTVSYDFVWDDVPLYLNKAHYPESGRMNNLSDFWTPGKMPMYAPVTYTVWAVIASLSPNDAGNKAGMSPELFHLANMFVHIANSILVFLILLYLFKNNIAALSAAAVFLLHPLQVESVAWVSELRGLLAAFFGFLAVLMYLQRARMYKDKAIPLGDTAVLVILLVLSFLSKPNGIVFPLIILLIDFFYLEANKKRIFQNSVLFGILTLVFFLLSVFAESHAAEFTSVSLIERILLPLHSFIFYLYKTILPINLTAVYGKTPAHLSGTNELYIFAGIFIVLVVLLYVFRSKLKEYSGGLLISFVSILPTSGLAAYYYQTFSNVADRYFYIGMLGVAIIISIIFRKIKTNQKTLIVSSLIVLLFILSTMQISSWSNEFKLWDKVIENSSVGIPQAYMGRGEEYLIRGNYEQSIADFTKAVSLNPAEPLYYYNRGNAYLDIKQYKSAVKDYDSALARNEKLLNAYVNRAMAYSGMNQERKAIEDYKKVLSINPNQSDVCNNIGISYAILGKYDSARIYFNKALAINPNDADALENLKLLKESINKKGK